MSTSHMFEWSARLDISVRRAKNDDVCCGSTTNSDRVIAVSQRDAVYVYLDGEGQRGRRQEGKMYVTSGRKWDKHLKDNGTDGEETLLRNGSKRMPLFHRPVVKIDDV